jgi:hypothetical protein
MPGDGTMTRLLKFGFMSRRTIVTPMEVGSVRTNNRPRLFLLVFIIRFDIYELKVNLGIGA